MADALGRQTGWRSFKRESGGYWSSSTLPCQIGVPIGVPARTIVDAFRPRARELPVAGTEPTFAG